MKQTALTLLTHLVNAFRDKILSFNPAGRYAAPRNKDGPMAATPVSASDGYGSASASRWGEPASVRDPPFFFS